MLAIPKQPNSAAAAAAKSLQSCPTLCDPRDGSLPGSSVPGILQARTLPCDLQSLSVVAAGGALGFQDLTRGSTVLKMS